MKKSYFIQLFILILLSLLLSAIAQGATIKVPVDKPTIQSAINSANDGDIVLVSSGTYLENIDFLGKAITVKSENGPDKTIIEGTRKDVVVKFTSRESVLSILQGFTIKNGIGGILITSSSPTIIGNIISNNTASDGAGISLRNSMAIIKENTITNNQGCDGIGISISFSSPIIQNNIITNNSRSGCSGGTGGGGIGILGTSKAQILNNIISNNRTNADGGAISLFAAGEPVIFNNIMTKNQSDNGGGISLANNSDALILQNLIINNTVFRNGGGICWLVPSGARGPMVINNTIANNSANQGSGIFADGFDARTLVINNIIIAKIGQIAFFSGDFNDINLPITRFNNVFSLENKAYGGIATDLTGKDGNISADPLFIAPNKDNYALQRTSPNIDAGDNNINTIISLPINDFLGRARILDGNFDGKAVIDLGAIESLGFDTCIQDENSKMTFLFESTTGDYLFNDCAGLTLKGKGSLSTNNNTIMLKDKQSTYKLSVTINKNSNTANVSLKISSPEKKKILIQDNDITNNSCSCN